MKMKSLLLPLLLLAGCGLRPAKVDLIPVKDRVAATEIRAQFLNAEPGLKLAGLKGKVVLLNFWATWCGPCVMEMPALVRLADSYRGKGLEVVGLSLEANDGHPKEFFDAFLAKHHLDYPNGLASSDTVKAYGINAIPASFFIDRSGKIALVLQGARSEAEFTGAVERLLSE